jgi:hypothetical protein
VVHRLGLDRLFVALNPDEVQSILVRLAADLDTDLTAARVRAFCAELVDEDPEDDPLLDVEVQYDGRTVPLVFEYVRDSEAGAELMILGPPPVVQQVQRRLEAICGSGSLRLIPATPDKAL